MKKCILASCPFIEKIGKKHQKQFTEFLEKKSVILLEQIRTIDKKRIDEKLGSLSQNLMEKVNLAIKTSLDIR